MYEFSGAGDHPGRVILTDDPLRAKMLAAHHLENAVLMHEQKEALLYFGSYGETAIALAAAGSGNSSVLDLARELSSFDISEIVYVGVCASATEQIALRSVLLADGGSRSLLNRALTAAARTGVEVAVRAVSAPGGAGGGAGVGSSTGSSTDTVAGMGTGDTGVYDDITTAFYERAKIDGVDALSILTVSENTKTGEKMEEHERRSRLNAAARLVFETMALDN